MKYRVFELGMHFKKNIALLVTKEEHCPKRILADIKNKKIHGEVVVIIGNHPDLESLAKKVKIPFHYIPSAKKKLHEEKVLKLLDEYHIDLVVLARYMQILSPDFVFRHEGRIINIHPSLLPAFPGPRSYHQAYNKGVDYVGVTAHFVTTDLDEGPIICQGAFKANKNKDDVNDYIKKGQTLEEKVLSQAVQLFCDDRLSLRRGKVIIGKKENKLYRTTKSFYK